jgi:signal transduction histidine kinase/ligand-binding sensor domain-containing protein/CheY-like chemotaxis protein
MNKIKLTTIFLLALFAMDVFSMQSEFWHLQPKDGLNDGEINSIVQDEDGIMWFATWSGLISYDGYEFNHYRPQLGDSTSLPDKKIKQVFIDNHNNLWIATSKYLVRYIKRTDSFVTYRFQRRQPTATVINGLTQIGDHLLLHLIDGFYILPFTEFDNPHYKAKKLKLFVSGEQISDYHNFATNINNNVYVASNDGNTNNSTIYSASLEKLNGDQILNFTKIVELPALTGDLEYLPHENNLYMGTSEGIFIYSLDEDERVQKRIFAGQDIQNLEYTSNNKIYCSSIEPELLYYDLHTGKTGKYTSNPYQYGTLLNNKIHTLYEDFSENLWVGHQGQGISILNLNEKAFHSYRHDPFSDKSLTNNKVMCFAGTEKAVFVGLRTGGINHVEKHAVKSKKPEFTPLKIYIHENKYPFEEGVWDIQKKSDDLFWVGSDAGLLQLKKINNEWLLVPFSDHPLLNRTIRKILIDKNNNLWCGVFDEGLILVPNPEENQEKKFYQYKTDHSSDEILSDNVVISMKIDSKGRFWIGTVNGLNLLKTNYQKINLSGKNKPDLSFKQFVAVTKDSNFLNNNEINCIFENFDGKLWIATQGGGINILDPETYTFSHITEEEGLPSNDVLGILSDKMGTLWMSTTKGLVSYNQHKDSVAFTHYNSPDGIQGDVFMVNSYYQALDGEMFFGGDNGFTRFYPEYIKPNDVKPKLVFTNLRFSNEVMHIGDSLNKRQILSRHMDETKELVLPYNHKTFSIGVAAIHYQYPYGNEVTYILEGYDKKWKTIPAYYSNIYYSNLPSGKYTLRVKAISSDNQISESSKVLTIEVLNPWYATWYMILIYVVVGLSAIGGIFFIIVNRQKLVYDTKIDKLSVENTESKMAFLTNIAHGLKTPLSLVIAPIDDLVHNYSDIKPEWKNHLHLIQRNSNYLLKLINQIIDFRKLNAGKLKLYMQKTDIARIVREVVTNFNSFENKQKVKIHLEIPFESLIISIDAQKIEEVLYNLISNAFKHTPQNGHIDVSMRITESSDDSSKNNGQSGTLKISVFNEGETIQTKDKEKIFERFYKVNDNTEGAGIGLSFSKSLVEMHGGFVEAEPIKGQGMAFHVFLPFTEYPDDEKIDEYQHDIIYESEVTSPASVSEVTEPLKNISDDDNKLKIVLVEDNEDLRGFLKNVLSKEYCCYEASNGQEGLEVIRKIIPDIVIADVIMPEKDGYQLCKDVKASGKTCHIPVILLTAKNSQEQIITGYEYGADAYVTKPFDLNIITSQISRLIKNRELIRKKYHDQNFMVEVSPNKLSKDDEFIVNFRTLLEKNISDPNYNVKSLATSLNVSSTQLYRKIKALTGYSPVEFMRIIKLQKAYELLLQRNNSVKEVCYMSGFNNISYFIKCFRDHFSVTPASLKDKGSVLQENSR